jgi:bacterioferritin-associated ferredoxin
MYVCICNRLRESDVRSLAEEGLGFDEIQSLTNCGAVCGSCREFAEEVISSACRNHVGNVILPMVSSA